jgi:hypothetical protein
MNVLSRNISLTNLPRQLSHNAPPELFGQKRHGSLTAAQWSNLCLYSLLITLTQLWGFHHASSLQGQWLRNYWHLCCIVRESYRRCAGVAATAKLRYHCNAYITSYTRLFPEHLLRPTHHFLLHIVEQTEWAGPMPERWAYPFERINGWFQRLNTNHKQGTPLPSMCSTLTLSSGQIESTFLHASESYTTLAYLLSDQLSGALSDIASLSDRYLDTKFLEGKGNQRLVAAPMDQAQEIVLTDTSILALEAKLGNSRGTNLFLKAQVLPYIVVDKHSFTPPKGSRDLAGALVEFRDLDAAFDAPLQAGIIHEIFLYQTSPEQESVACVCVAPLGQPTVQDPFAHEPDLRTKLFAVKATEAIIISPDQLYPAVQYLWDQDHVLVISSL